MPFDRASGLLLHPTSLPGAFGNGDIGPEAYRFVEFLAAAGQRLWQVLPLNPTGFGNSPYQCYSAFAGNPALISPELLARDELLDQADLEQLTMPATDRVDFEQALPTRQELLRRAFWRWREHGHDGEFQAFCHAQSYWLETFALFMALKGTHDGEDWSHLPPELALREPAAIRQVREQLDNEVVFQQFLQYQFFRQWSALKRFANEHQIKIVGDMPIFVSGDSADVWANPHLFTLDEHGHATHVAGVPPDYFSATGQRWGNPLYRWDALEHTNYAWWTERFRTTLTTVDILRIDHFRGFEAYWSIPASEETAINGSWEPGPGAALFHAIQAQLGPLPLIAEDLGIITPPVEQLRNDLGFPGMRVLQFAFGGGSDNPYLPYNYLPNTVVYTGTHDNDTTLGWWSELGEEERQRILRYTGGTSETVLWDLVRLAMGSVADLAIIPLQDALGLGSEARMNRPGIAVGNWGWRFHTEMLTPELAKRLRSLAEIYGRI